MQKLLSVGVGLALMSIVPVPAPAASRFVQDPYPSTYAPIASAPVLISNATVLTGTGVRLDNADVLLRDGRIAAVGTGLSAPADAVRVDGPGKWVTPGIIDVHSHLGVYPSPGVSAHSDGNEMTAPVTANVWAEHSVWPQDPGFAAALAGGVTSMQVLPGSANLVGGRGVTLKNVPATTYQAMKFPGAPWGLKMACGENPKRVYGGKGTAPGTRMGNVAGYRAAFIDASEYIAKNTPKQPKKKRWFSGDDKGDSAGDSGGKRDLKLDTLAGAIQGDIRVHIHCYRADEMATMLDLSKEFGFKIAAFHHAVEAYKLADRLAEEGVCGALWADRWGFKMEAFDGEHRPGRPPGQQLRDRAFGFARGHPAPEPGSSQGDRQRTPGRHRDRPGTGHDVADLQRRALAGRGEADRQPGSRQDGRRGGLERQPLQFLRTGRKGLCRWPPGL